MISIVIVNFHAYNELSNCLNSVYLSDINEHVEIIVIDNACIEEHLDKLKSGIKTDSYIDTKFLPRHENLGFPRAANIGAEAAKGEIILFLNPDTKLLPSTLQDSFNYYSRSIRSGILGIRHISPSDQKIQLSFGNFPGFFNELRWKKFWRLRDRNYPRFLKKIRKYLSGPGPVDWVSGSFLMINRDTFFSAGMFNENYFIYFEDIDLCRKVKGLNQPVIYNPDISLNHLHGISASKDADFSNKQYRKSQKYYYKSNNNILQNFLLSVYLFFNGLVHVQ